MPTSMFQFDSKRIILKQLPDQRLKFYQQIENKIRGIFAALITKSAPISEIKSQILQLRYALTMDFVDTTGRPLP
jgi:hypothetical protein